MPAPRNRPPRRYPEAELQRAVVKYLDLALPRDAWFTAINPRPGKTAAAAAMSRAMGMKPGVPDLLICWQRQAYWIELKAANRMITKTQAATAHELNRAGSGVWVARSIQDVETGLTFWAIPLRAKVGT